MNGLFQNNRGQSLIEFLLSFTFVFGLVLVFLKLSLNYTTGYLVHYATFMASRSFMVIDRNSNTPEGSDAESLSRAKTVFARYNIPVFISTFESELQANMPETVDSSAMIGVWAEYNTSLSATSLFGGSQQLLFRSESFLGKEPTRAECIERICRTFQDIGADCSSHVTFADNGC